MSFDVAISAKNISKAYTIWSNPAARVKHPLFNFMGEMIPSLRRGIDQELQGYSKEFHALRDISFEVKKGETLGIIGRNGSGKSTLLQIIAGTLQPTEGSVTVNGRVAALLELGSGFNPEFTGRQNVYLNASILGLTREETEERFAQIEAFAGIGDFIDQPVKSYSSGMSLRLAFAVQSQVDPDVLIVDEALAVGDAKFQAQCFERLRQLKERGTSILLVTHSSEQIVTHCSKAILLDHGCQIESGEPRHIVNRYMDLLFGKKNITEGTPEVVVAPEPAKPEALLYDISYREDLFSTRPGYNPYEYRWGDRAATILDFLLLVGENKYPSFIESGQIIMLVLAIRFNTTLYRPIVGVSVKTKEGVLIYGTNTEILDEPVLKEQGSSGSVVQIVIQLSCDLAPGDYFMSMGVATRNGEEVIPHDRRFDSIHLQVNAKNKFFGLVHLKSAMAAKRIFA
ncbi:MAG: ABC transporter ATP-binding protein [Chthoniobacterales bacterium]|nr:ABC transporter ATP-binding protein [Chthoniobacterales bacterium]